MQANSLDIDADPLTKQIVQMGILDDNNLSQVGMNPVFNSSNFFDDASGILVNNSPSSFVNDNYIINLPDTSINAPNDNFTQITEQNNLYSDNNHYYSFDNNNNNIDADAVTPSPSTSTPTSFTSFLPKLNDNDNELGSSFGEQNSIQNNNNNYANSHSTQHNLFLFNDSSYGPSLKHSTTAIDSRYNPYLPPIVPDIVTDKELPPIIDNPSPMFPTLMYNGNYGNNWSTFTFDDVLCPPPPPSSSYNLFNPIPYQDTDTGNISENSNTNSNNRNENQQYVEIKQDGALDLGIIPFKQVNNENKLNNVDTTIVSQVVETIKVITKIKNGIKTEKKIITKKIRRKKHKVNPTISKISHSRSGSGSKGEMSVHSKYKKNQKIKKQIKESAKLKIKTEIKKIRNNSSLYSVNMTKEEEKAKYDLLSSSLVYNQATGRWCCLVDCCNKSFVAKCHLRRHVMETHLGREYYCNYDNCEHIKGFKQKSQLFEHIKNIHQKNPKKFECIYCNDKYSRWHGVKRHIVKNRCNILKNNNVYTAIQVNNIRNRFRNNDIIMKKKCTRKLSNDY